MLEVQIKKRVGKFELDLDLRFDKEFTVLLGESGNGKSLTLSAIAGFLTPDKGYIHSLTTAFCTATNKTSSCHPKSAISAM